MPFVAVSGVAVIVLTVLAAWLLVPEWTPLAFVYLRLSLPSTWRLMMREQPRMAD